MSKTPSGLYGLNVQRTPWDPCSPGDYPTSEAEPRDTFLVICRQLRKANSLLHQRHRQLPWLVLRATPDALRCCWNERGFVKRRKWEYVNAALFLHLPDLVGEIW